MSTVVPAAVSAFGNAVTMHRDASSYTHAAYALLAAGQATGPDQAPELELQQLTARLAGQRQQLTNLAAKLQVAAPMLDGPPPATATDLTGALARARHSADQAESGIRATERQVLPALLPTASPTARALLVYGGWSFAAWIGQCGLLFATNGTSLPALLLSLCGMPVLAFAASFLTLYLFGQPQAGTKLDYSLKLGALICFLGMPLAWIFLIVALTIVR